MQLFYLPSHGRNATGCGNAKPRQPGSSLNRAVSTKMIAGRNEVDQPPRELGELRTLVHLYGGHSTTTYSLRVKSNAQRSPQPRHNSPPFSARSLIPSSIPRSMTKCGISTSSVKKSRTSGRGLPSTRLRMIKRV